MTQRRLGADHFDLVMQFTEDFAWVQRQYSKKLGAMNLRFE